VRNGRYGEIVEPGPTRNNKKGKEREDWVVREKGEAKGS